MMCDLTIAADDALFGEPEIRFSNVGPVMGMPFVIGLKRARQLLYTGDFIDAATALQYGMVNRVVPRDVLAPVYAARTEVGMRFDEIREQEGLGAALRWRAAQFAE